MAETDMEEKESFAELFEASQEKTGRRFSPGEKVSGKVIKITKETIFVSLGGKSEGFAEAGEFLDKDGGLTLREGDLVEMRVASVRDGIHLTKGMKVHGADALDLLREAKENLIPVEGRVAAVTKGGLEIDLSGKRAFCPFSQIDISFTEKPEALVGMRFPFRIIEIKEKGRNIIVSRRVILEEEREKKLKEILAVLKPGLEVEGKVTKLTEFGAFIDVGGIEGMAHVSEISHQRIRRPSDILTVGQQVKVKVLRMEPDKEGRPKISLSIKVLEPDSWEKGIGFQEGDVVQGKVTRLTDFGAFVEVAPGVDGLVHVSEISFDRIPHPNRLLHEGDTVEVLVMGIDLQTRRISLSIKEAAVRKQLREEGAPTARLEVGQVVKGIVDDMKPYGLFVRLPELGLKTRGLLPIEELNDPSKGDVKRKFPRGKEIQAEIISIDEQGRIRLSQKTIREKEDREDYRKFTENEERNGALGTLGDLFKNLKVKAKEKESEK